jgi:hypothetical protein
MNGKQAWRFSVILVPLVFLTVAAVALLGPSGCSRSSSAASSTGSTGRSPDVSNAQAAGMIREYLASLGPGIAHVSVERVEVTGNADKRTLSMELRSDGSNDADSELMGLCMSGATMGGWREQLNRGRGVGLTWMNITVRYPTGPPDSLVIDVAGQTLSSAGGAPRFRGGPPTATPGSY